MSDLLGAAPGAAGHAALPSRPLYPVPGDPARRRVSRHVPLLQEGSLLVGRHFLFGGRHFLFGRRHIRFGQMLQVHTGGGDATDSVRYTDLLNGPEPAQNHHSNHDHHDNPNHHGDVAVDMRLVTEPPPAPGRCCRFCSWSTTWKVCVMFLGYGVFSILLRLVVNWISN